MIKAYYKWILVQGIFIQILVLFKSLKKMLLVIRILETFKFYKDSWKEFKELESIDKKYYASDFYVVSLNKIDPYGWFQWYFRYWKGRRTKDGQRQIGRWKRIVSRFRGVLIKLIGEGRDSPKIRQVLLHMRYEF